MPRPLSFASLCPSTLRSILFGSCLLPLTLLAQCPVGETVWRKASDEAAEIQLTAPSEDIHSLHAGVRSTAATGMSQSLPQPNSSLVITADSTVTQRDSLTAHNEAPLTLSPRSTKVLAATGSSISAPPLKATFQPNPSRALWLALVLPGAGQFYNRKFWKLPIFYGGFLGCTYAYLWNQQMYRDYQQAYLDIMDDDPKTESYKNFLPPSFDVDARKDQLKTLLKQRKDRYRRYRDLSVFCFAGVYLLSVIDAYVDAQLSVFDISPDLSLQLAPARITTFDGLRSNTAFGVGASLSF